MMTEVKKLPKRSEVNIEDTWRLEDIFATDEAWETEFIEVKGLIPQIEKFKGKLGNDAKNLLEALQLKDNIAERFDRLFIYANLRHDQDMAFPLYQSQQTRIMSLQTDWETATSYFTPEILEIPEMTLTEYVMNNPSLGSYQQMFKKINRMRPHVLTADKETLLALMGEVANASKNTYDMISHADLEFPMIVGEDGLEVQITHGNCFMLLQSTNRDVRETAFKSYLGTYKKFENTFASTLAGAVKSQNVFAKIRNFDSARQASLAENNIPERVYDQLVETVNEYLPLFHRYVELRKKMLGVDELHIYDMFTPITPETKISYTYAESIELVKESLKIMGAEYSAIIEEGFADRWVDVYENEGKRGGAYSAGKVYGAKPYILMNWQDTITELFTLTHEFGHSAHSYLSCKNQPYVNSLYSAFVAEVAANCNEALLNHYLLARITDRNERMYLINNILEGFSGSVFTQTRFAEFEQLIHQKSAEGVALTADALTEWYYDLNKKYYGDDVVVDNESGTMWAMIPHFYLNFYVYTYATGNVAALSLAKQILEEGETATTRYIDNFLKAGCSDFPIDVLKNAGIDMSSKQPIIDAMAVFEGYLNEMEELLN